MHMKKCKFVGKIVEYEIERGKQRKIKRNSIRHPSLHTLMIDNKMVKKSLTK